MIRSITSTHRDWRSRMQVTAAPGTSTNTLTCPRGGGPTPGLSPEDLESYCTLFPSNCGRSSGSTTTPETTTVLSSILDTRRMQCAADFGNNRSIAAAFGVQDSFLGSL